MPTEEEKARKQKYGKKYRTDAYLTKFIGLTSLVENDGFYAVNSEGSNIKVEGDTLKSFIEQAAESGLNTTSRFVKKVLLKEVYTEDPEKLRTLIEELNKKIKDDTKMPQDIVERAKKLNTSFEVNEEEEEEEEEFQSSSGEEITRTGTAELLEDIEKMTSPGKKIQEPIMAEEEEEEEVQKPTEQPTEAQTKESLKQELDKTKTRVGQMFEFIMNMDKNRRDELSGTIGALEERVKTLNTELDNEYQGLNRMFELDLADEINKLSNTVATLARSINVPDLGPNPDDPNSSTNTKGLEQVALDTTISSIQEVKRYHPGPLKEFFGSIDSDIDWDPELLQTIMSSDLTKEETIEYMDNVIDKFGMKINVLKRKSDTLKEYNELRQMAFCVMRNLQRGSRYKTASMKVSDLVKLYSGSKYSQESPKQFGENRNFIPKINKVKLSPGDIYIKSESGPALKYAPKVSRSFSDNYL